VVIGRGVPGMGPSVDHVSDARCVERPVCVGPGLAAFIRIEPPDVCQCIGDIT